MKLGELLDRIRGSYVERLQAAVREAKDPNPEPAYRRRDGSLAREGPLALPARGDLFTEGEMVSVDSKTLLSFEPLEFTWEGSLRVVLGPFPWDALPLFLEGSRPDSNWSPLLRWFEAWFDGEDVRSPGSDGLCGVVHFLSDPLPAEGGVRFSIDLGSAPVAAFEELLDAAARLGPARLKIGETDNA